MGEIRPGRIGFRGISNTDFHGDDAQHTTALDRFEVNSGIG